MSYHYWLVNRFWRQNDRALTQIAFRQRPTPASIEWLSQKPGIHVLLACTLLANSNVFTAIFLNTGVGMTCLAASTSACRFNFQSTTNR